MNKEMKKVTFYTKPDCGLCERAETVLRRVFTDIPFEWVTVDITQDEASFKRYVIDIPVVLIDGIEHARHAVDEHTFRQALKP